MLLISKGKLRRRSPMGVVVQVGWAKAAAMLLLLLLGGLTSAGCASRPITTIMRGSMNMDGNMNMNGDMRMDGDMRMQGDMNMSGNVSTVMKTDNTASRLQAVPVYGSDSATTQKSVVVVDVDGILVNKNIAGLGSMGENPVALFREKLDAITTSSTIGAIVLRINSPGGGVTASDVMARDLAEVKHRLGIPVVACLMDVGAGGGYYLATAADHIVSHPTSIVGGIGVVFNSYYIDEEVSTFGFVSRPIVAGSMINMSTPDREFEPEERALMQGIADEFHGRFIQRAKSRSSLTARNQVLNETLFDGRVMTGREALDARLVDQLGYLDDAVVKARSMAGLPADSTVMMLRRDNDRAYTLLDVTPNSPTMSSLVPLKIPALDRSQLPTFMYLWQPEPTMVSGL